MIGQVQRCSVFSGQFLVVFFGVFFFKPELTCSGMTRQMVLMLVFLIQSHECCGEASLVLFECYFFGMLHVIIGGKKDGLGRCYHA